MRRGKVYFWTPSPTSALGGSVAACVEPLARLSEASGAGYLCGHGGAVVECGATGGALEIVPIGGAQPDAEGNFIFEPGRGGGRMERLLEPGAELREAGVLVSAADFRWRYRQASHFGEVNTYFHLDRIAAYITNLLDEIGAPALPRVDAVVMAHGAVGQYDGIRAGVRRGTSWVPFQGGHYRLPSQNYDIPEHDALSFDGEIHLGPGWKLLTHGALVEAARGPYRANASHNAGILYHEYGHHISRHTADFRANALVHPHRQNNRKTAIDEGSCDYWAATIMETPHIWAWHRHHGHDEVHPRSLVSPKTMADYDHGSGADPHTNGTIWAAALWDLRMRLAAAEAEGVRRADLLVLKTLVLIGRLDGSMEGTRRGIRCARESYSAALSKLLEADEILFSGRHREIIRTCFSKRGILPEPARGGAFPVHPASGPKGVSSPEYESRMRELRSRVPPDEIPDFENLYSADELEKSLAGREEPPMSLIVVGDIMLGGRTSRAIAQRGPDYPFEAVLPVLKRADIVLGNLEGPFARRAKLEPRTHSYRVKPELAGALKRAGIGVVTLANNHLLDCGRAGVSETLETLALAGVAPLGAGFDRDAAHEPIIRLAAPLRIGLLGYYWNRRCAATAELPGSAMDTPEALESDICRLRGQVDRLVVTFHWGVPYDREPSAADREKARTAIDCGADAVIGHHPHVMQPFEIYRGRPIFYSVGNFAFGSGNSRAEGLMVGFRFEERKTTATVFPLYVKNRDPRVDYQPKVLKGRAAKRRLELLAQISGAHAEFLKIEGDRGSIELASQRQQCEMVEANIA